MAPKNKGRPEPSTKLIPPQALPVWPALSPLPPASDLAVRELLPGQIVAIPKLWTAALCRHYVSFLSSLPLTTTPGKPKRGDAVRVNDRYQIDDPAFAARLWNETALEKLVMGDGAHPLTELQRRQLWGGDVVGLSPNIRIYRYTKGQFFDQHYDDANNIVIPGTPSIPARTTWTLLLYLTSSSTGCVGGETVFYPEPLKKKGKHTPSQPFVVELETGLALLHRHGAECMLHEGREVREGEKWVIRTDLCVRR